MEEPAILDDEINASQISQTPNDNPEYHFARKTLTDRLGGAPKEDVQTPAHVGRAGVGWTGWPAAWARPMAHRIGNPRLTAGWWGWWCGGGCRCTGAEA